MKTWTRLLLVLGIVVLGAAMTLAVACGDDDDDDGGNGGDEPTVTEAMEETPMETDEHTDDMTMEPNEVHIALEDGAISNEMGGDLPTVAAGTIAIEAHNDGPGEHNLLIIETDLAEDALPVVDGMVDESAVTVVGSIDTLPADEAGATSVDLEAGDYVLISNLPGDYEAGMFATLTVE